jgi:site-specific recombinase XerC
MQNPLAIPSFVGVSTPKSPKRTKALHILNGTGDIEAVRVLLGHTKIESTARYLRIAKRSDPIAISRAFDI